jgi:hypothetical protein
MISNPRGAGFVCVRFQTVCFKSGQSGCPISKVNANDSRADGAAETEVGAEMMA